MVEHGSPHVLAPSRFRDEVGEVGAAPGAAHGPEEGMGLRRIGVHCTMDGSLILLNAKNYHIHISTQNLLRPFPGKLTSPEETLTYHCYISTGEPIESTICWTPSLRGQLTSIPLNSPYLRIGGERRGAVGKGTHPLARSYSDHSLMLPAMDLSFNNAWNANSTELNLRLPPGRLCAFTHSLFTCTRIQLKPLDTPQPSTRKCSTSLRTVNQFHSFVAS